MIKRTLLAGLPSMMCLLANELGQRIAFALVIILVVVGTVNPMPEIPG